MARGFLRNNLSSNKQTSIQCLDARLLMRPNNAMHWYSAYNCALLRRWEAGFVCSTNWNLSEFL